MSTPLADRLRPQTIEDMVGQKHLLGENMPLRNIVESGYLPNLIFYGPSGTGKTTLARIIAKNTNRKLHHINGTNASTADMVVGLITGVVGLVICVLNYPVYAYIKSNKE